MTKVSVITISYNNAEGLRRTIESVVAQNYSDYEYIIIDGGSTDNSLQIIESYASHISYWVSEPDKGVYNAMNKGIAQAKGEYLHFLNSGDCYDENLKIVSDWKFFFKAILGGEKTVFLNTDIVLFEMDGISTNRSYGEKHLEERKKVISELMPPNLLTDYERLRTLESDAYIIDTIKKHSLMCFVFRALSKVYKLLKIK